MLFYIIDYIIITGFDVIESLLSFIRLLLLVSG